MTQDIERADRPSQEEIQITPEMIEAGREVAENFYLGDGIYPLTDRFLMAIFGAMCAAQSLRE